MVVDLDRLQVELYRNLNRKFGGNFITTDDVINTITELSGSFVAPSDFTQVKLSTIENMSNDELRNTFTDVIRHCYCGNNEYENFEIIERLCAEYESRRNKVVAKYAKSMNAHEVGGRAYTVIHLVYSPLKDKISKLYHGADVHQMNHAFNQIVCERDVRRMEEDKTTSIQLGAVIYERAYYAKSGIQTCFPIYLYKEGEELLRKYALPHCGSTMQFESEMARLLDSWAIDMEG